MIKPDILVESIPITKFISLLSPKPPKEVIDAVAGLKWRAQVYLFITLNKEKVTNNHWIYFPTKDIPFGRITEVKNFSKEMSPKGKTSLFVEFFTFENDKIWNMSKKDLFNLTAKHLEKLGFFRKDEVRKYYLIKRKNVYPIYDLNYTEKLRVIKKYLDKFSNLIYIGRAGRFKYCNQDHSLEMGILAARTIIERKKYDIESCRHSEYFYRKIKK